jgi:hypothetical protein
VLPLLVLPLLLAGRRRGGHLRALLLTGRT